MMLQIVKDLNAEMEDAAVGIRKYCKAKTVPLEDRWAVAVEAKWAFPTSSSYLDFDTLLEAELCWYDFGVDRYKTQTILCEDFAQQVAEATWPEEERTYCTEVKGATRVSIEEVKEYILQLGYSSFVNDW